MAGWVFLQDLQGVIGPLAFAVELNVTGETVVLHLNRERHRNTLLAERKREVFL